MTDGWCATCGAKPGEPCLTGTGRVAPKPHRQRVAPPSERRAADKIPAHVREEVHRRSRGRCEVDTPACPDRPHFAQHIHHVLRSSQGGPSTPENLLDVCLRGHDWIHAHPGEARSCGWLTRRGDRPSPVPVALDG